MWWKKLYNITHNLHKREHRGFTLLELLVIVVILVVLAAIAIPVLLGQKNKAKDAKARTTVATASQLLNDTRGTAGLATYNPDTYTISTIFGTGGGGGMSVAGEGELVLPNTAQVWSDNVQITRDTPVAVPALSTWRRSVCRIRERTRSIWRQTIQTVKQKACKRERAMSPPRRQSL